MGRQLYDAPWYGTLLNCRACSCRDEARRPVPGTGPADAEIMVVGQNPGSEEDIEGVPFIGAGGKELDVWLAHLGLDRRRLIVTNQVKCHTDRNRVPTRQEIMTCGDLWLRQELQFATAVQVLIPLGKPALEGVMGRQRTAFGVLTPWWFTVDFDDRTLHVIPLAHPAYLLRAPGQKPVMYGTVLPAVLNYLRTTLPEVYRRAAVGARV